MDKELMEALRTMMREEIDRALDAKLEPIKVEQAAMRAEQAATNKRLDNMQADLDILKEDVGILKEDSTITRSAVNTLLEWAEEAQIEVKIPLYKKAQ